MPGFVISTLLSLWSVDTIEPPGEFWYAFSNTSSPFSYNSLLLSVKISTLSPPDRFGLVVNVIPSVAIVYVFWFWTIPSMWTSNIPWNLLIAIGLPWSSLTAWPPLMPPNTVWFAVAVISYCSNASASSKISSSPTAPITASAPLPPEPSSSNTTISPGEYVWPPVSMYIFSTGPFVIPVIFDFAVNVSVSSLPPLKSTTSCSSYIEPCDVSSNSKPFPSSSNKSPLLSSWLM